MDCLRRVILYAATRCAAGSTMHRQQLRTRLQDLRRTWCLPLFLSALILASSPIVSGSPSQTTGTSAQTTGSTGTGTTGTSGTGSGTTTGPATGTTTGTSAGTATTGQTTGQTTGATTGATTATTGQTTGQTTGETTTGGTATTTAGNQIPATPAGQDPNAPIATATTGVPQAPSLPIFGASFFEDARRLVNARRAQRENPPANQTDPTTAPAAPPQTAAGPSEFVMGTSAGGRVPDRYQLGPGDRLTIRVSSPVRVPEAFDLTVDATGSIRVPGIGVGIVVRGLTLGGATQAIQNRLRNIIRDANVDVELRELRSITVRIVGEVYASGTYEMPAVVTLYNALYFAGGPNSNGTFRQIRLNRSNGTSRIFDLYRLLINGDSSQDVPLQPGDVILVPPAQTRVSITGEVVRPAIFELRSGERLRELLQYAGGLRPSAVSQNISIESVVPGVERRRVDANVIRKDPADNPVLYDGDRIEVFSIRPAIVNSVTVEGAVDQPRRYAYSRGLRVADVIESARGLLPEAYLERADLFRLNPDNTTTLIPIDLQGAVRRDLRANIEVLPNDRIVVYRVNDVRYMGERRVVVQGAVQRPGTFDRASNMTVRDLILQAGGLAPNASTQLAFLQRTNPDGTPGVLERLNLTRVLANDPAANLLIQDRDLLRIPTIAESQFQLLQQVEVVGAVQRPGTYPRSTDLRLRDLLELAGGPLPQTDLSRIFVQRTNPDGTPGQLITLDGRRVLAGDPAQNVTLEPRDRVTLYTVQESNFESERVVEIAGAVQRPGNFPRAENMRLNDLINLAGGLLPTATRAQIFVQRINNNGTQGPLLILNADRAAAGEPDQNILLQNRDRVSVFTQSESQFRMDEVVSIRGAVQRPGSYPRSSNMTLRDLLALSGGLLPNAADMVEVGRAWSPIGVPFQRIDAKQAQAGVATANIALEPGDTITVPERSDLLVKPRIIVIRGAVRNPGPYLLTGENDRLSNLIKRAGNLMPNAFPKAAEFVRDPRHLGTEQQGALQPRLLDTLRIVAQDEYRRASALADLDRLRVVFSQGSNVNTSGSLAIPSLGGAATTGSGSSVEPGQSLDQALAKSLQSEATTQARPLGPNDLNVGGNLNVDVVAAMRRPGSTLDIELLDGDVITIPERPTTVQITGAVMVPSSVIYDPSKGLQHYVDHAGGVTRDADITSVIIIRANGTIEKWKRGTKIELGDHILIPTKVMAIRLRERQSDLLAIGNSVVSAGVSLALIRSLFR